jgi:hypothetical protein
MASGHHPSRFLILALPVFLSACATPLKGPPPVIDLSTRDCSETPDLSHIIALALPTSQSRKGSSADATIDGNTPCLAHADGSRSLYAVFLLPVSESEYLISVASLMLVNGVFAPRLSLLSETGAILREIPDDAFVFRGERLTVQIRNHKEERYLLVGSAPQKAGQGFSQAKASVNEYYGGNGVAVYVGQDVTRRYQFTHSGIVTVSVGPIPDPKPR